MVIPSSVTSFGNSAFAYCTGLTSVTVNWATPLPINSDLFAAVDIGSVTLHVPVGTEALYQAAAVRQDFGTIAEPLPATHLNFDGINDRVELPNESNFDFTSSFSIFLTVSIN